MIRPKRPKIMPHPTDPTLALVPLTKGYFAVISAFDVPAVGEYHWGVRVDPRAHTQYAGRSVERDGIRTTILLHRFIGDLMGLGLAHDVDHENGNGLDCRRSNLRDATRSQNVWNARRSLNNSTGIKGVTRHRSRPELPERFRARIGVDGKSVYLGAFKTIDEAAAAVRVARPALHGAFSNHGGTA